MKRIVGCTLALLLAAAPAWANTLLHVSETATVMVPPDELDATLRAEAVSAEPAVAQQMVNALMAEALSRARRVPAVSVATGGYSVFRIGSTQKNRSARWQAAQVLTLKSHDAAALLQLVGALQQQGLATAQLGWRLSRQAERKAHTKATRHAIAALRARVAQAAKLLGLHFDSFKEVRLDSPAPSPLPRTMTLATATMAEAAPPPQAVPQDVPVNATAEADAILVSR